jgi:hypothetical protein
MPTINKLTLIFAFRPLEEVQSTVANRVAGFSESFWYESVLTISAINAIANTRVQMMCPDGYITGWRQTPYTYAGNKLLPGKTRVGTLYLGGGQPGATNSPDDCLRISCNALAGAVVFNQFIHCIPDENVDSATFVDTQAFTKAFGQWVKIMTGQNPLAPGAWWVGRDPTQPSQTVVAIQQGPTVITTAATIGAGPGDYIRLRRVYSDTGLPIKGSFLITAAAQIGAGPMWAYTVSGLPLVTRTSPSGTARKDLINAGAIAVPPGSPAGTQAMNISLYASRKVGRPFGVYRGRRSKQRA